MPRKSAASLSIVAGSIDGRPPVPEDLTPFQQEVWRRTVAGEASAFFKTAALQQLLKEYCRHVETADRVTKIIDGYKSEWLIEQEGVQRYEVLSRLRDRETKALGAMASKLRLTNQSRYTPQAAATAAKKSSEPRKPWEAAG